FKGEYEPALMYSILHEQPSSISRLRPEVPGEFQKVVTKALAKNPNERYQHMDELIIDLFRVRSGLSTEVDTARPPDAEGEKLAAIMFTDIVEFTRKMNEDEPLMRELLEEHRRILRQIFTRHSGHEIETTGDGFLIEFDASTQAAK